MEERLTSIHQHQICLVEVPLGKKLKVPLILLTFTNIDAERILYPHTDALVILLQISNFTVHHVQIDNGSSADILYLSAYEKLRVEEVRLKTGSTNASPLVGFAGETIIPRGSILLPVILGTHLAVLIIMVNVLVINPLKEAPVYNAIIGQTTLYEI